MERQPVVGTDPTQRLEVPGLCPLPNMLSIQPADFLFASETS